MGLSTDQNGALVELGHMKWVWMGVFAVVALFGFGLTEWEVIQHLIENEGVGDQGVSMLAFAAGYTLPLTAGVAIIVFLALRDVLEDMGFLPSCMLVAVILWGAGAAAEEFGLGLLPEYEVGPPGGHFALSMLIWALVGYFNTYGWPLMIVALAIGAAVAIHADAYLRATEAAS